MTYQLWVIKTVFFKNDQIQGNQQKSKGRSLTRWLLLESHIWISNVQPIRSPTNARNRFSVLINGHKLKGWPPFHKQIMFLRAIISFLDYVSWVVSEIKIHCEHDWKHVNSNCYKEQHTCPPPKICWSSAIKNFQLENPLHPSKTNRSPQI